jgi:hypothetical protein
MARKTFLRTTVLLGAVDRMSGQKRNEGVGASFLSSPAGMLLLIRNRIRTLLRKPQPELYIRHQKGL